MGKYLINFFPIGNRNKKQELHICRSTIIIINNAFSCIVQIQHSRISAHQTAVMETGPDRWQRNAQVGARSWQDGQRFLQGQNEGQVRQNIQRLSTDSELRTARDLTRM